MRLRLLWSAINRQGMLVESVRTLEDLKNTLDPLGQAKDAATGNAVPVWDENEVVAAMEPYLNSAAKRYANNSKANHDDLMQLGRMAILIALRSNEASTQRDITSWLYRRALGAMLHGHRGKDERLLRGVVYGLLHKNIDSASQRLSAASRRLNAMGYGNLVSQLSSLATALSQNPHDEEAVGQLKKIYDKLKMTDVRIHGVKTGLYGPWGTPHDEHQKTQRQFKPAKSVVDDGKRLRAVDALLGRDDPERHTDAVDQIRRLAELAGKNGRASLNQRELEVLQRAFGLGGQRATSGVQLAKEFGISEPRIVQIVQNAIKKLHRAARRDGIG